MVLSDRDIEERLGEDLVIDPILDAKLQIQPSSVDLRLGNTFRVFKNLHVPYINPLSDDDLETYTEVVEIDDEEPFILHPSEFVLGTTLERVEVPPDLVARVEGRSSLGRLAVIVHASLPADEELLVWTPEDGLCVREIGALVEERIPCIAVSFDPETLEVGLHEVTDWIENPTREIYEVVLDSGRTVRTTWDHNLFTLGSGGEVDRIESSDAEGAWVMIPGKTPEPPVPEREIDLLGLIHRYGDAEDFVAYGESLGEAVTGHQNATYYRSRGAAPLRLAGTGGAAQIAFKGSDYRVDPVLEVTEELAWTLGFYIAEGYARRKHLTFVNTDRSHLKRVENWFSEQGKSCSWNEQKEGTWSLTVPSALWSSVFTLLAGSGKEKRVPARAWNWSDEVLKSLMDGLLDGDGSRRETRDVLYAFNEDLANDAMKVCDRLGYAATCRNRQRETGTEWTVEFSEVTPHRRGQLIPTPTDLLREARAALGLSLREAADLTGHSSKSSISNIENGEYETVKKSSLEKLLEAYESVGRDTPPLRRLRQLVEGGVSFDRVREVRPTGREVPTYDLEVQPGGKLVENFLGGFGGVFLSNTAGYIDPGYRGQITLELSNLGTVPVALYPKMRVSQVVFEQMTSEAERPYGAERGSKYQDQEGPIASRITVDEEFDTGG
ncbi:MAG: dCTP deaminase, dUMP-forming [Methanonatronarchaeales archaeon]|nr:dCTP deaminase, dUMP-forming [Methanonatronarchaeales archaeon]